MAMIFRLRWRLAHLICPELGVEARLKTARVERARVGFFDLKAAKASLVAKDTIKRTQQGSVGGCGDGLPRMPGRPHLLQKDIADEFPIICVDEHHHG